MTLLPDFNDRGDLPVGVHRASLAQVLNRFGRGSTRRQLLANRLSHIYDLASQTACLARFVVFGSFITEKPSPNDVDVFMIMDDNFDMQSLIGELRLLFESHSVAQAHFGASVFWIRRMAAIGGEESAIEDWQIKRDGSERGIIEIVLEDT
jgi:hypothetical protein